MMRKVFMCVTGVAIGFTLLKSPQAEAGRGAQCTPCKKTADCGPKLQCYDGMCKKFKSEKCIR